MNLRITNVKIHKRLSEETLCFTADLCLGLAKVAEVSNRGTGGENDYRWLRTERKSAIEAFVQALPPVEFDGMKLPMDMDLFVSGLVEKFEEDRQIRNWCKTKLVFRLKDDKPGTWRTIKLVPAGLFTCRQLNAVRELHGDKIERVANVEYGNPIA